DPGVAQRAEEDRVVIRLEVGHLLGRDGDPRAQIAIRAVIPLDELQLDVGLLRDAAEHFGGLARDLHADAVTGEQCNPGHVGEYTERPGPAPAGARPLSLARPRSHWLDSAGATTSTTPRTPVAMSTKG